MSLNHLINNAELKVEVADLSFGAGQWKTKTYVPNVSFVGDNVVDQVGTFLYQCDDVSLRIKGYVLYSAGATPQNNFSMIVSLPAELQSRFSSGSVYSSGTLNEHPFNNNVNSGTVAYGSFLGGAIDNTVFYRQNQTTQIPFRVNIDIVVYSAVV